MRIVILAAGDFPKMGSEGERLLKAANVVIACDSAANTYRRKFGKWPTVTIGDMDSFTGGELPENFIKVDEQETNDLQKAIRHLTTFYKMWSKDAIIVGATGKREDHTIGNIYRALEAGLKLVTDEGVFYPIRNELTLKTFLEQSVSIFAIDPETKMTSEGLAWPLEGVKFTAPYVATLNRTSAEHVRIQSTHPAYLFLANCPRTSRIVVSLGSNQGERAAFLKAAQEKLSEFPRTRLLDASEIIETEGVEVPEEFKDLKFLNRILVFETLMHPVDFSRYMHLVEDELGRVRSVKNGPRTIDIDLIDFDGLKLETPELTLPHPRAKAREFVMKPLSEVGLTL